MQARVQAEVREEFGPTRTPEEIDRCERLLAALAASRDMYVHAEAVERGISIAAVEAENAQAGVDAIVEQIQQWKSNAMRRKYKRARK